MKSRILLASVVLVFGSSALAQDVLLWKQRVHDDSDGLHCGEVSIGAARQGRDVMVTWIERQVSGLPKVYYNVSLNGENTGFLQENASRVPRPANTYEGDPGIAYSRTPGNGGTGWLCALESPNLTEIFVWRKVSGQQFLESQTYTLPFTSVQEVVDKELIAVGPDYGSGSPDVLTAYFGYSWVEMPGQWMKRLWGADLNLQS